jgi:hypothetical protein
MGKIEELARGGILRITVDRPDTCSTHTHSTPPDSSSCLSFSTFFQVRFENCNYAGVTTNNFALDEIKEL